jgi:hypothetical protein
VVGEGVIEMEIEIEVEEMGQKAPKAHSNLRNIHPLATL